MYREILYLHPEDVQKKINFLSSKIKKKVRTYKNLKTLRNLKKKAKENDY